MLAVHGIVQLAHIVVGNFAREVIRRLSNFGMPCERFLADDGYRFIRREVVAIIFQDDKVERWDEAVGAFPAIRSICLSFKARVSSPRSMIRGEEAKRRP